MVKINSERPEKTSAFIRFLSQYHDPLNYLLIGAGLLALATHPDQPGDAIFIGIVLTLNAFFGFWQENKAEQEMGALKQMTISRCVVCRDGMELEINTSQLVPGDIVKIEEGLNVPADLRVSEAWQCKVDESALTGESMPAKVMKKHCRQKPYLQIGKTCFTWVLQFLQVGLLELLQQQECKPNLGKSLVILLKQKLPRRPRTQVRVLGQIPWFHCFDCCCINCFYWINS